MNPAELAEQIEGASGRLLAQKAIDIQKVGDFLKPLREKHHHDPKEAQRYFLSIKRDMMQAYVDGFAMPTIEPITVKMDMAWKDGELVIWVFEEDAHKLMEY